MAKRGPNHPGYNSPPNKRSCTTQSSISSSSATAMSGTEFTPDHFGIHTKEIEEVRGLDKDYKQFWNEKGVLTNV